ncbi:vWA domain-containing protein [Lacrimispora sp.]|uniref:vWA domain-containing protein n=1 Tax=Lacrimispora sp. TaxID=2719234 RepID=UPI00289CF646|nr:VWA domain-containing protein [Lacrimispora sp.]
MKIWRKIFLATGMIILLFTVRQITSAAGENQGFNAKEGEVVFLLDTSGSMNTYDKKRLAIDAIRQAAYSLPSNYKAGLVSYNTGIQTIGPVGIGLEQLDAQFAAITYKGYTNAGEGLNQAVGLFSDREKVDRSIVMVTDGEIDMPDKQAKESSRILYSDAIKRAKEDGIKIYIIAVGSELNDPQMHIFAGAEMTDGAIYWQGQSGTLVQIMNRILYDRMNIPKKSVGVTDGNGGSLHVELPSPGAERVRIILTASQGIQNVTGDYAAEEGHITSGQNFAVLEMTRPAVEAVDVHFQTPELTGVEAYMTVEYTAEPVVDISYRREEAEAPGAGEKNNGRTKIPLADKHYADLKIWLKDIKGKNGNLWNTPYYDGQEVSFRVNGVSETGKINNGIITYTLSIDGVDELSIEIDSGSFTEHYEITQPAFTKLAPPQDPIPEPDYRPLWIILGVLAAALILILALWVKKKNTTVVYVAQPPASREPAKKMETKTCTYSGKFNIYVVRTADGRDVPPQTYQLFGRNSGRMTLDQILSACKIKLGKIGEDDIIIYPGPDHSVIIMDQSERCTVLRGMEILKKGMGYPVFYNEKITITFEDESTEMEVHYKNLKPSERKA